RPPAPARRARFAGLPFNQCFGPGAHFTPRGGKNGGIHRRGRLFVRRLAPGARDARIDEIVGLRRHCRSPSSRRSLATAYRIRLLTVSTPAPVNSAISARSSPP